MPDRNSQIHRILSFEIKQLRENDHYSPQAQIDALIQQDPTTRAEVIAIKSGLVVSGEDELELLALRSEALFGSGAEMGEVKVNFKETIRKAAEAEGKYIRQTGGLGNYGHCKLRVEPNRPGMGNEFINDINGGVVPREYIKPIDQGVKDALELGIIADYPIIDVKVTLYDGSYHETDSNEMAFKFAGSIAFKEAARKAYPVLLEPVVAVEVIVPEEHLGTIIGDINSRRGRMPLAEVLTSSEHGRPTYSMRFAGYEEAPPPGPFDQDAAACANKPRSPKMGTGSAAADLEE
jgi:elongation factor G